MRIFGDQEQNTITQLETCMAAEPGSDGVLCADAHLGYSAPIGSAIAYHEHVSPSGVGFDIACGNKAVRTTLTLDDLAGGGDPSSGVFSAEEGPLPGAGPKNEASGHAYSTARETIAQIMDEINERISFGIGQKNNEPVDHPVIDKIKECSISEVANLWELAQNQLGTVGAGNHYVDLFADDDQRIWVGVHFGSRGFGHKVATGFLAVADGLKFGDKASEGEMMSPPKLIPLRTYAGESYLDCMELAGEYAYAGRDTVVNKVLEILGAEATEEVHNHHNFAWLEEHTGQKAWVVRKGSTPLFPGQLGFVGATMGEDAVILEGVDSPTAVEALYSAPHGAGRVMSRTEAAGKRRKRWTCDNRDCSWVQPKGTPKPDKCPTCGNASLSKRWVQSAKGKIDFVAVQEDLKAQGIELRGGAADEGPAAYKRLPEVLAAHGDAVRIKNTLHPIGVAMAGGDTFDPYKD